jgi:hypothetical protein
MKKTSVTILLVITLAIATSAQDKWDVADRETVRLPPSTFTDLPPKIVRYLEGRGCTIPQGYMTRNPHNVIKGQFAKRGQSDWAVLCSRNRESWIIVFWGGSIKHRYELTKERDYDYLQVTTDGSVGFSRVIDPVGSRYIEDHYKWYGGPKPPRITHQGINDIFAEKASVVLYFHKGKWLELQGAD